MAKITITREELYNFVWDQPLTKLAKRFGLSDVGLAKQCKFAQIPLPGRGHWMKIEAGHTIKQTPLPPLIVEPCYSGLYEQFTFMTFHPDNSQVGEYDSNIQKLIEAEKLTENKIQVQTELTSPHLLIRQVKVVIKSCKPNDNNVLIPSDSAACIDIRVNKKSLMRSLCIMDALIKAIESRGHSIYPSKHKFSKKFETVVKILDEEICIHLEEILKREQYRKQVKRESHLSALYNPPSTYMVDDYKFIPTGRLSLQISKTWDNYSRGSWNDAKVQRVEICLNDVIINLLKTASVEHDKRIKKEIEQKKLDEERHIWKEQEQIRLENERIQLEDEQRTNQLLLDTENWHKSQRIRDYIDAVIHNEDQIIPGSELKKWIEWANKNADKIDPLITFEN